MIQNHELKPEQLKLNVDPAQFTFKSTADLHGLTDMIGQDRARHALQFGMDVPGQGFNIFVLGQVGTGRSTMVRRLVEEKAKGAPTPPDWVYVNNFADPAKPRAISLPPGLGCQLRRDMDQLVESLKREIPRAFESEEYAQQKANISRQLQEQESQILSDLERQARQRGYGLARTPMGTMLVRTSPSGEPLTEREYQRLSTGEKQEEETAERDLQQQVAGTLTKVRARQKQAQDTLNELDRQVTAFAIGHFVDDLEAKYAQYAEVEEYLEEVRRDVIDSADVFRPEAEQANPLAQMLGGGAQEMDLSRYKVNVIVDSCQQKGAPIVAESNPTYYNLIGQVEQEAQFGALVTDFTKIRAGAFHKANGGYLILEARDVLTNPFSWDAVKRVLKDGRIDIEEMGAQFRAFNTTTLEPEPIPANTKVVLIGEPWLYYLLYEYDDEFQRLFKVKADFGSEMDRDQKAIDEYALFVANHIRENGLRPFDPGGVARIVEYGSRLAEDQKKLATRFSEVADMVSEASFWATQAGHELVSAADVQRAIDEKVYRSNRIEERIREMIDRGVIMVDTEGAVAGQVNGLSVSMLGDYEFGQPTRITARTYVGRGNVIAIDREAELSGPIHNKGVLILAGYLGGRFAQELPLSLSASLTFEQSYEGVEGDSASSAELYALLSSLAGVPIRQNLAVTGSVNQRGEVQPIGGATAKIEGFFDVCRSKGLTGDQGVLIPAQNADNLNLRHDVVQAVREAKFHIYQVRTIDEGIELLTGMRAGEKVNGKYPEGTVNYRVAQRLQELARIYQEFSQAAGEEEGQPQKREAIQVRRGEPRRAARRFSRRR
ncbi:MAG TPA: ATP-binding protein [Anaerolineae bacterium]|nr:ATP-binding protein [Anaerolineae bacterium]HPL27180.1 ATP-binding protein [Anaerolineae bacterium]